MRPIRIIPRRKQIEHARLVYLAQAVWFLNDIQLNYWNEIKGFLDKFGAYRHDNKKLIKAILTNLRNNTFANIWKECEKDADKEEIYEDSGKTQDRMEEIMEKAFDAMTGYHNRFVCFQYTDFGPGDICWINSEEDGPMQIKVLSCRILWEQGSGEAESEMVIKVIALNRDGKEYGEPFWVRDCNIAKHKKEFKDERH